MSDALLQVNDLRVRYRLSANSLFGSARTLDAVRGISFDIKKGEALGIVGESGSGKSSLARAILGLLPVSAGQVQYSAGTPCPGRVQMVFQNPAGSLNPRMTIAELIAEPLRVSVQPQKNNITESVSAMMTCCGLDASLLVRYPHELSGGQCQRVAIARALITHPDLLICDEAVSALDVSIQAQIVNLLCELRKSMDLTLLFISHDLSVVRHLCDRVLVMYRGRIVEDASAATLFTQPQHEYTRKLLGT